LGYALEREVFKMGGIKQKIDSIAVKTLISYLDSDPEIISPEFSSGFGISTGTLPTLRCMNRYRSILKIPPITGTFS